MVRSTYDPGPSFTSGTPAMLIGSVTLKVVRFAAQATRIEPRANESAINRLRGMGRVLLLSAAPMSAIDAYGATLW